MPHPNKNTLYEPLFRAVTSENSQLRRTVKQLEAEVEAKAKENERLKEELQKQQDANQKLRALLFKRERHRTKRPHELQLRSAASYRRPEPTHITDRQTLTLSSCPDCGSAVSSPQSERTRLIEDIVFQPQPQVTEWTIQRHYCAACAKLVEGRLPGVVPRTSIGPNTLTYVVLAKYRWNLPYAKIVDNLQISYGLHISQGEIANLIERAATLVGPKWQEIIQAVKADAVVHCDETGWYVNGKKVWAHAFATEQVVLYEIIASRGKGVVINALGPDFTGTRVTDCLPNYKNLPGTHQICWAHLTREASENADREPGSDERRRLAAALTSLYAELRHRTKQWDQSRCAALKERCWKKLQKLHHQRWRDDTCQRLLNRLTDFDHALFTCLDIPGVSPDNNHAERVVRKIVVQRKISGGNRSPTHALAHAKLMSVIETLRLEGGALLPKLQAVLQEGLTVQLSGQ